MLNKSNLWTYAMQILQSHMYTFLAKTLNGFVPAKSLSHASGDSLQGIPAFKQHNIIEHKVTGPHAIIHKQMQNISRTFNVWFLE